ncbi:MAG TPA: DUF6146 family protein [Bacteroidales bacterium]|nr:DUF6146 family protein [Bacteroidales bacterium]HPI85385.1 DUF6146 family protein [Bacteroidales bacterium]HPM91792.1 DUF6146 family protein [Bacteroidales bacterium]
MKKAVILFITVITAAACTSVKNAGSIDLDTSDSTVYEITIIDNQFDNWYLMNFSPAGDRSNEYYRSMNNLAVSNWNQYYNSGRYKRVIDSYIDYWPTVDYGMEVNRKLYWYFKYIEESSGIRLSQ